MNLLDAAVTDFTAALNDARALGDSELEGSTLISLCNALYFAHRLDDMAVHVNEALSVAEASGNEGMRAWVLSLKGRRLTQLGHLAEAIAEQDECIRLARALDHKRAQLDGLVFRGFMHFLQSEYQKAEELLAEGHRLASELRDALLIPIAQFFLALTLGELGRISEALSLLHGLLQMERRNSERNTSLKTPNTIGWIYREAGDLERAMQWDREGAKVSRQHRLLEAEINSVINLGYDHTLKGETSQSLSNFRDAEILLKRDDWLAWRFNIRLQAVKTEHLLAHGDLKEAQECALGLLSIATHYRARKYIATAHKLLGEIAAKRGDITEAIDHLNDAREVLSQSQPNLLAWKVEASLGRMLLQAGRNDDAREAFARSAAIVDGIASNISDEALRTTFLNSTRISGTVA